MKPLRILLAAHLAFFLGWAGLEEWRRADSTVIWLQTLPIDPRDLISGHYMILRYGIGEIRNLPGFPTDKPGRKTRVGVRLVPGPTAVIHGSEKQIHVAESVRIPPPRNGPQPDPNNGVWAAGTWTGKGIVYGIERYYFSEKRKEALNTVRSGKVYVAAIVGEDGTLRIKDIVF
ncbi:MAG: hypothetical protein A3G34_03995 [Candidatus Lindowbacteria bacterium RIFCSPLOWO2_12_FULL_62_27]|nr:MAG: hypothetical protein A3G34_03995 [Candidatus Lindowbacteria bacterium RIFCSPLOWO2_12_FULL_62_27]OGH63616.1 MAG: hypothetical protein A3I06_14135 [Candidatus Lindowbacteria bacterium RIFCSPLOWO2_02_FULL_62_12]